MVHSPWTHGCSHHLSQGMGRPEAPLLLSNELDMRQPWWKVEKALLHEAKNQRTNRLASRQYHHNLITGLDWHTYHEVKKTLPSQSKQTPPQHLGSGSSAIS